MVKIVVPPAIEPVGLSEFKSWMRGVPIPEDQESMIEMLISAGREEAEKHQNAAYIEQTLQIAPEVIGWGAIVLPRPPFKELVSVICYANDGTETNITNDFYVNDIARPAEIQLKDTAALPFLSPRAVNPFVITFKAGGDVYDVPQKVKQAILLYATWSYLHPGGDQPIPDAFYALLSKGRVIPV
jgi:phage conserved hypothetical protein, phiE125 gp8 family